MNVFVFVFVFVYVLVFVFVCKLVGEPDYKCLGQDKSVLDQYLVILSAERIDHILHVWTEDSGS